jgi:hypothetical protein
VIREVAVALSRMKIRLLMIVVAVVGVVLGISLRAWRQQQMIEAKRGCLFEDIGDLTSYYGDFTNVSLAQSPYLRDVAEPIRLISGPHQNASDNVWMAIVFTDGKQLERRAEYITLLYAPEEITDTVMLGKGLVPACGPDERALLGLLQRWYRQDAEAQEFYDHLKRADVSKLSEPQRAKIVAVAMLKKLLKRN